MSKRSNGSPVRLPLARRDFVAGGAAACMFPAVSGCGADDVDVLAGDFEVVVADHSALMGVDETVLIDASLHSPIAVTRVGDGDFVVTGTECDHSNCTVDRTQSGWTCPCHGATFELEGKRKSGPAKNGLTVYEWTFDGDVLTVLAR